MAHPRFDQTLETNPAENYERYFVPAIGKPLARDLIRRANVAPDDRVLDVACGTGVVARLVLATGSSDASIAGLDPNAGMLAVARAAEPSIGWYEGPAEHMPLESESFDLVLCQMGLQFMSDRSTALKEMRRVLARGGRLLASVPGPLSGVFAALSTVMARYFGPQAAGFVGHVFSLHDVGEVEHLVQEAGFEDVVVEAYDHDLSLPPPRKFLWEYLGSTPLAAVVAGADEQTLSDFERDVLGLWAEWANEDGLNHRVRMVLASGVKAAA